MTRYNVPPSRDRRRGRGRGRQKGGRDREEGGRKRETERERESQGEIIVPFIFCLEEEITKMLVGSFSTAYSTHRDIAMTYI
jgi:hypothetical protein